MPGVRPRCTLFIVAYPAKTDRASILEAALGQVEHEGVENLAMHLSDNGYGPEQAMAEKELQSMLASDIDRLDEKEKTVIALYYKEQLKIKEISGVMGISESRVSQIHSNALRKLKKSLGEYLRQ